MDPSHEYQLTSKKEICNHLSISNSTFYRYSKKSDFPKPIRLSSRTVRYRRSDVNRYIQSKSNIVLDSTE